MVALHETLHAIGFGGSDAWDDLVDGNDWLGEDAILELGLGDGVIYFNPDDPNDPSNGSHISTGILSTSLFDGSAQEPVMDPNLTTGRRKYLTTLDLAFLRDLGYTTTVIPEPASAFPIAVLTLSGLAVRRRHRLF